MDNLRVLEFHGEMDVMSKEWIARELAQIEHFESEAVTILDLTGVRYLDTTFLNALLRLRERIVMNKDGARICLVAPQDGIVRRIFAITKLDVMFAIFENVPSARRSFVRETAPMFADPV